MMNNMMWPFRKVVFSLMGLVIVLAGLGVGYGHWVDNLTIVASIVRTVSEDGYCVGFEEVSCDDRPGTTDFTATPPRNQNYHKLGIQAGDPVAKDVGYCEVALVEPACVGCPETKRIEVVVSNAYPSYATKVWATIKNCGLIDIKIVGERITTSMPGYSIAYTWKTTSEKSAYLHDDARPGEAGNVLDITWINMEGKVLVPTERSTGELIVHVLQPAEQNHTYTFAVEMYYEPN